MTSFRSILIALAAAVALPHAAHAQYRGMPAGWPQQAGGTMAYYPSGNASAYGQPAYFVARPTVAAYANPGYFGAYASAPNYAQRPVTAAYYGAPTTAYYAMGAAQYAQPQYAQPQYAQPQYAQPQYAPLNAYRVTPAGGSSAGAEAYAGYGQPAAVNYVPPRFVYRTAYAPVPVYMYRPTTVYDPVTAQPVTCLQPTTTSTCMPQRHRWFSHGWFSWLRHGWCGQGSCGAAPVTVPTTAYCNPPCGQPYYPAQPNVIIPTVPAPGSTAPPVIISPIPAGPTVPPPGTRFPSGAAVSPADVPPSLTSPRTPLGPPATVPGSAIPRNPVPGSPSFPVDPSPSPFTPGSTAPSGSGFGGGGTFPAGANYSPGPVLRPPTAEASPTLHPSIQPVPDPAVNQPARPVNRAPQLLDPRDKTATPGDRRWAVVPAVWPKQALRASEQSPYRVYQERSLNTPAANSSEYDDTGWTSAR